MLPNTPNAESARKRHAPSTPCVIDANVWASGLLAKHPSSHAALIVAACEENLFSTVFSGELIDDIAYTLEELGADPNDAIEAALLLTILGEVFALKHYVMGCRDAEDDHLYELALVSSAHCVVSRDRDVLNPPAHVRAYLTLHRIGLMRPPDFVRTILRDVV